MLAIWVRHKWINEIITEFYLKGTWGLYIKYVYIFSFPHARFGHDGKCDEQCEHYHNIHSNFHLMSKQWMYKLCLRFFFLKIHLFYGVVVIAEVGHCCFLSTCTLSKLVILCVCASQSCAIKKGMFVIYYFILNCHWRKSPRINNVRTSSDHWNQWLLIPCIHGDDHIKIFTHFRVSFDEIMHKFWHQFESFRICLCCI